MKVVILAGGLGSRLGEETELVPKPLVQIGDKPMLWHIMKIYSHFGLNDFVICLGYKGYVIKEFFSNYFLHTCDVTFDIKNQRMEVHQNRAEPWRISLIETGADTMTGGRLKRVADHLEGQTFCFTYGDGVADVDVRALIAFHRAQGRLATVTAVAPPGRFGVIETQGDLVSGFHEKIEGQTNLINAGFFVLEPGVLDYIDGDRSIWEQEPMNRLAAAGQLAAYRHTGFWQPMDTLREKRLLEELWRTRRAPWKVWG
jgi:glucose-1-phosphate cytidylyltransferase